MVLTTPLWVVLDASTPDLGASHFSSKCFMDPITEVKHRALLPRNDDGRLIVRNLALRLRVDSDQV